MPRGWRSSSACGRRRSSSPVGALAEQVDGLVALRLDRLPRRPLGIAEALILHGRRRGAHLIIDAFQDHFHDAGCKAIETAGLADVCSLLRERSQLALPRLLAEGLVADAAFVDGSHIFHNVFVDLFYLGEIVRPGGLVILDDCEWPSVATAVRYFELNTGWEPQRLESTTRLRAYRLPDPRVQPTFESFAPFGEDVVS